MEESAKRPNDTLDQTSIAPKKKTGLVLMIVFFLLCVVPTLLLAYVFYQNKRQVSEQTNDVYQEYHSLSGKVATLAATAVSFKNTGTTAQKDADQLIAASNDLTKELTVAQEHATQKVKNIYHNNDAAYRQLEGGIVAAKEYVMFSSCTVKNVPYNAAIKTIQDNRRSYGIASGDGDYSPEIKRQQKVKDALNTIKGLNSVYLKCVESNTKYTKILNDDTTEINRYIKEFLDPFINALRTGKQTTIQSFMNKAGNKSWLSIGWRLYIDKTGSFTKDIENDKDTLTSLPKQIDTTDSDLLTQYQKVK